MTFRKFKTWRNQTGDSTVGRDLPCTHLSSTQSLGPHIVPETMGVIHEQRDRRNLSAQQTKKLGESVKQELCLKTIFLYCVCFIFNL